MKKRDPKERAEWEARIDARIRQLRELEARKEAEIRAEREAREQPRRRRFFLFR